MIKINNYIAEKLYIGKGYKVNGFNGKITNKESFLKYLESCGLTVTQDDKLQTFVKLTKSESKEYPKISLLVYPSEWAHTTKDTIRIYKDLNVFDEYKDKEIGIHKRSDIECLYDKHNADILIELMNKY